MNPAMSVATFATTTNPARRGGVIAGKDIMYVIETGRNPARPNPATSNPTLVTAPLPQKRGMLPRITTTQPAHSKCLRHVARVARKPNAITPATPLNGSSDASRSACASEIPLLSRKSGTKEKYISRIHEAAKIPNASIHATGIARTFERELGFVAVGLASVVFSTESACWLFRPITSQTMVVARRLTP